MRRLKALDVPIIATLLALPIIMLALAPSSASYVQIETREGLWRYSLDEDRSVTVTGPVGETVVEISGGRARIVSSDCPTQSCTHGSIERCPQTLVCLPNEVVVTVEGEGQADAIAY